MKPAFYRENKTYVYSDYVSGGQYLKQPPSRNLLRSKGYVPE